MDIGHSPQLRDLIADHQAHSPTTPAPGGAGEDLGPILVVGATGTTGRLLIQQLPSNTPVRAASRGVSSPTATSRPGVEEIVFDWADPSTHDAAFGSAQRAYLVLPAVGNPAPVVAPVLERAARRGLRRAVLLSAASITPGDFGPGEVSAALPHLVQEPVVLRPSWMMQNFTGSHPQARSLRGEGVLRSATQDGRVPFIDAVDIAAVAATVLLSEDPEADELVLTGPEALSYDDVAAVISQGTGRHIRHERLDADQVATQVFADLPPAVASMLAGMDEQIAADAWSAVTGDVEKVLGRPAASLTAFVARHREELS